MKIFFASLLGLIFAFSVAAQNFTGKFEGIFKTTGPSGTISISIPVSSGTPTGEISISFSGQTATAKMTSLIFNAENLSFTADLADSIVNFRGSLSGGRLIGSFEGFEKGKPTFVGSYCAAREGASPCAANDLPPLPAAKLAVQRADDSYDTSVKNPAYVSKHPKVLFDEAHNNFHKTTGGFKPFADLIRSDGYAITPNTQPFSADVLKGYDILVVSNARGERGQSAFSDAEIDAVVKWVEKGGSFLFIADHTPFGGYAEKLANRFGIDMSKGYTDDPQNRDPVAKDLLFSRDNKLLNADHPITTGRKAGERIGRVVSFTGQSLKAEKGTVILKLSDSAYDEFPNSEEKKPAAGRAQAIAMKFGKGKIFVSGEAAMFTAQLTPEDRKFGMNVEGLDNRQYALNVVHWLSGLLK